LPKFVKFFMIFLSLAGLLTNCANKEINQLQGSVSKLETQIQHYQTRTANENLQASNTLNELKQSLNQVFEQIRLSQEGLDNSIQQVSARVGTIEQQMDQLQQHLSRVETFSTESAGLAQNLQQSNNVLRENVGQLANHMQALNQEVYDTRTQIQNLKAESDQKIQQMQQNLRSEINELGNRMAKQESANRDLNARIQKEMGTRSASLPSGSNTASSQPTGGGRVHVVAPGETLSKIAAKYNISVRELQKVNGVEDPSKLLAGQRLRIP
jgi:LysM repeat protein